ncbi:hypothetical protein [Pararhodonellum marinum]|uniref:hypothetical protein n=1 Tax=Pararhodonellum marinum TaxID=2755358 RepID=UPI001890400C|nr:hypothetical protein [Pararhodonellum marinum]
MNDKRNIQTIAPFLANDFVDLDEPIFDTDKYSIFLTENSNRLKNFKKYLIWKLHDSWITDFEIKSDKLKLSLNDFTTHVFADAIVEKFKVDIEHDKLVFPVILEFKGNLNMEFFRVEEYGGLESIDQITVDEYLGEQILKLNDDLIEIAFELWHKNPNEDLPGERILMIASAKELNLTENQDEAWNEIFGKKYYDYYHYFKEQFESERYVSDYTECLKLVGEYNEKIKKPTA